MIAAGNIRIISITRKVNNTVYLLNANVVLALYQLAGLHYRCYNYWSDF